MGTQSGDQMGTQRRVSKEVVEPADELMASWQTGGRCELAGREAGKLVDG